MFLDCRDDCRHGAAVKIELHRVTRKALRDKCLQDTAFPEELYCGMFLVWEREAQERRNAYTVPT